MSRIRSNGTYMRTKYGKKIGWRNCSHAFNDWAKAGVFDSTMVRVCEKCGCRQVKHPKKG